MNYGVSVDGYGSRCIGNGVGVGVYIRSSLTPLHVDVHDTSDLELIEEPIRYRNF